MLKIEHNSRDDGTPLKIHYIFKFISGTSSSIEVFLNPHTLNCIVPESRPPGWASLDYEQCENCPLDKEYTPNCPIAYSIASVSDLFGEFSSHETAHVIVMTRNRDYAKSSTLQEGLTSLIGLYMATSGCPHLEKLKPLALSHLPFASLEESVFRTAAFYLMMQYYRSKKGKRPDWNLKGLSNIYENIRQVNAGMTRRLRRAAKREASLMAVANLDHTASLVPFVIDETLEEMEGSLSTYLED